MAYDVEDNGFAGRRGRIRRLAPARWSLGSAVAASASRAADEGPFVVERLLREREALWTEIAEERQLDRLIRLMVTASTIALAGYGALMGISYGLAQALSSAIKLPLLFLLTLAICLPTFYLFNLFCGGRLSARQVLTLVLAAITVMAALTAAFAPISLFFLMTARDYEFFKLLNVAILTVTGIAGLSFLVTGMRRVNTLGVAAGTVAADGGPPRTVSLPLLWLWLLLFAFVGTQLGWTLRPFFGAPLLDFQLFRPLEGNFYAHLAQTILNRLR